MLKISRQQALNRWDILPDNLREALFSEYDADILWRICENQHLSEDKIRIIAILIGNVILGFIHLEDLAGEIKQELGINPEIANSIASEIERKIFAPIRSDLEKIYAPVEALTEEGASPISEPEAPKIIPTISLSPADLPAEASAQAGTLTETGPLILQKETEFKPLAGTKKSLGGLFGFLKKKKAAESVKAQIEIGSDADSREIASSEPPAVSRVEPPEIRVVHYSQFEPTTGPFPASEETKIKPMLLENLSVETEILTPSQQPILPQPPQSSAAAKVEKKEEDKPISEKIEEKRPVASKVESPAASKAEPLVASKVEPLDLRKPSEPIKPAVEKPPTEPSKTELPKPSPSKPEEEIIDLGMFR